MERLGINDLEENHYDPLEEDKTAIDAKKSILFNCWELPRYGVCGHLKNKGVFISIFLFDYLNCCILDLTFVTFYPV
jgi:hypothetical protein